MEIPIYLPLEDEAALVATGCHKMLHFNCKISTEFIPFENISQFIAIELDW